MAPAIMENETVFDFEQPVVELETQLRELDARRTNGEKLDEEEFKLLQSKCETLKQQVYANLTPWQRVQLARHPKRPFLSDYLPRIFNDFMELHGDRTFGDDASLLGGLAFLEGEPVMVLGHRKGRSLAESMERNFGMPHPEGYRKALRLMKMAEQFKMPVLTFVDTAGAYPGIGAEERGQAEAIARNLREMAGLKVPIIVTILGEGGSGGALAIGVGDVILMLENAWYSVISPEGCAAILFHDATKAQTAAAALKITALDLKELNVVDEIIQEPLGGAHKDPDITASNLKVAILRHLKALGELSTENLLVKRYEKYRSIGAWQDRKLSSQEKKPTSSRQTKKKRSDK